MSMPVMPVWLDEQGHTVGHGYLEMTGYASPLRL